MAGSGKARKTSKGSSKHRNHWQALPRDKKGRWIKQKRKKPQSTQSQQKVNVQSVKKGKGNISSQKSATPDFSSQNATTHKIQPQIPPEMNSLCPRCGGDMHQHRIRCGPERLVSVKKCEICNFWVPIPSASQANQIATTN